MTRDSCVLIVLIASAWQAGCSEARASGSLIEAYERASCVASRPIRKSLATREWDTEIALADGHRAAIYASDSKPSSRAAVHFDGSPDPIPITDAGDYFWPDDVRIDPTSEVLYVRMVGTRPVPGEHAHTWLFAYDLRQRKLIEIGAVEGSLSERCQTAAE